MVKRIQIKVYRCPYCSHWDINKDSLKEHIMDCHEQDIDYIEQTQYLCKYCESKYNKYSDAADCEEKHENKKDLHYELMLDFIEKEKLISAAQHENQKKLIR